MYLFLSYCSPLIYIIFLSTFTLPTFLLHFPLLRSLFHNSLSSPFPSLFNTILHHSSFPLITILSLFSPFSLWLTEGVQRHQSVCGWGAVCSGERAEAHRRPSSSRGEEAALSHGHRYPKPNYTGKTVLANWAYTHTHTHCACVCVYVYVRERERIFEAPPPLGWMLHDRGLGGYERRGGMGKGGRGGGEGRERVVGEGAGKEGSSVSRGWEKKGDLSGQGW